MDTITSLIQAVEQHRGEWPDLARKADLSYSWLSKFANGHIPNPGIGTLGKLRAALDQTPAGETPPPASPAP